MVIFSKTLTETITIKHGYVNYYQTFVEHYQTWYMSMKKIFIKMTFYISLKIY